MQMRTQSRWISRPLIVGILAILSLVIKVSWDYEIPQPQLDVLVDLLLGLLGIASSINNPTDPDNY